MADNKTTEPITVRYTSDELSVAEDIQRRWGEPTLSAALQRMITHTAETLGLPPPPPRVRGRKRAREQATA